MSIIINALVQEGRELAVIYKCARCNEIIIKPLADVIRFAPKENPFANDEARLRETLLPPGWRNHFNDTIFCKACAADYERFMKPPAKVRKEG